MLEVKHLRLLASPDFLCEHLRSLAWPDVSRGAASPSLSGIAIAEHVPSSDFGASPSALGSWTSGVRLLDIRRAESTGLGCQDESVSKEIDM